MSDHPYLTQAIAIMRKQSYLDCRVSDEKIAGMFGTQRLELSLAMEDLKAAIIGTGPGRRFRAGLLRFSLWLGRMPGFRAR